MQRIRVLLADDHQMVREGIRAMLETAEDIEVVGEATNGLEALSAVAECNPHLVLMDLRMPVMDGVEATRRLKREFPEVAVIILTGYTGDSYVVEAVKAGASGYLLKGASKSLLVNSIRAVYSGGALLDTSLLQGAVTGSHAGDSGPAQEQTTGTAGTGQEMGRLTPREREVLALMVEGQTNKEIAASLSVAQDTVKKHVQNIITKLGANDRTDAAVRAIRAGLVS
ncbi:MAG: response regulator transcription factor [Bacteroidetes bacterium]|nr:response regulator transcription factor [Bacteroidota bacterium]